MTDTIDTAKTKVDSVAANCDARYREAAAGLAAFSEESPSMFLSLIHI